MGWYWPGYHNHPNFPNNLSQHHQLPHCHNPILITCAGPFTAFFWVTLPLVLPSIAVAALVAFLVGYTEFAIGWLFGESSENVTLAKAVSGLIQQLGGSGANLAALAILMSLPVVIIFLLLQRYLIDRLLIGSVET